VTPEPGQVLRIHAAFKAGDLAALRAVRTLLELGADPNPSDHHGFPPIIAALSCSRPRPGAPARPDLLAILELLLAFGADPNQRGINDYTPLHMAVGERNQPALERLLARGADPTLRTRIDEYETPRELAERAGLRELAARLAAAEARPPR
jgi:ankyrin repeat protein